MADILTDSLVWMPLVRLRLGVDDLDLPDDTLNNSVLVELAEGRVSDSLPNFEDHLESSTSKVLMAAVCFLAAEFCDFCEQAIFIRESVGKTYSSERQRTDWQQRKVDLVGMAMSYIYELEPDDVTIYSTPVVLVSPAVPLYRSF